MIDSNELQTITQILNRWSRDSSETWDELIPHVYQALRQKAGKLLSAQPGSLTLNPTALVHEIYLQFQSSPDIEWQDRRHFFSVAAVCMRRLIIDHIRRNTAEKRGGGRVLVSSEDFPDDAKQPLDLDFLSLDSALNSLEDSNPECCQVVELRYFAGLTVPEVADVLDISERKVYYHWNWAKSWLYDRLYVEST